ncbi:MAG: hypothetical protein ABIT08_02370, partial [Bacteroidia bacterium]
VILKDWFVHAALEANDCNNNENEWNFGADLFRKTHEKEGKKYDKITIESFLNYYTPGKAVKLASVNLTTLIETKFLKKHEVDQPFWEYLMNTGIAHCRAAFAYKTAGSALQGHILRMLTSEEISKDITYKINNVWGPITK